ncbi:MAG: SusC/RagA family TonB-linked outer membrane protein [Bacteroidetes bacterium]|nr:SusC/RagA family TonB-linked outer membrane protein [Bacteroidota bacterium]
MNYNYLRIKTLVSILLLMFLPSLAWAQQATLTGRVTDESGEGLIGATVLLEGTTIGGITDLDGSYRVSNIPAGTYNLLFTYVGYVKNSRQVTLEGGQTLIVNMELAENVLLLNEAVVVGYGTTQTKDLTGAVTQLTTEDFLSGNVNTAEQLITGKVAGVQITSNGGAPGSGSRIRVRGGSSLNASNDPLIVIDGVPVDNDGISGSANALNLINPDDIESIALLKDASAAAIYGSRAANGVLLITTKKGKAGGDFQVTFSSNNAVTAIAKYTDVMTADQYRAFVNEFGTETQKGLLGEASTDWQKEIYRLGFATNNDISFTGGLKNLPYRLGLEYYSEDGILKRSALDRYGATLNLNPKFFDDHLSFDVNGKFSYTNNFFADQGAIGAAVGFDPTQTVNSDSELYGGYYEWLTAGGLPNVLAGRNPLGLLNQREDESNVYRFLGNVALDYKFHFLPELRANLNVGGDFSRSNGTVFVPSEAASNFNRGGVNNQYEQEKDNQLLEFYLNYAKTFGVHKVDATAGYSYQNWFTFSPSFPDVNVAGDTVNVADPFPFETENTLISFFGRLNYTLKERYLLTATLRNDASSRFSPDTRNGLFPSVAAAWRISEESFLRGSQKLSNLKLRLGWGVTGQQDIFNDYPYIANYSQGTGTAAYQFGDVFYTVLRPDGYDANIKWEETTSWNAGLDFGFNNNRFYGSLDFYKKVTEDLLATVPVPAGTNFTNQILTNVGSLENTGIELMLGYLAIEKDDISLEIGANATWNVTEITNLSLVPDPNNPGVLVGGVAGGVGNTIQIHTVGFAPFTFYAFEQLYDDNGNPIENDVANGIFGYVDQNGDGDITADDRIRTENPQPDVFAGLYANLRVKKWNAGFTMRAEIGNYLYNNVASQRSFRDGAFGPNTLNNLSTAYYETNFKGVELLSDHYIENASYARMDNIFVGYNFGNLGNSDIGLSLNAIVQNAFVITGYSGLDPEVAGGIDNNIYPRPRVFSLNLNLRL